jgi:4-hydroxy-4-methyl-2-oxoglutarate aldolase
MTVNVLIRDIKRAPRDIVEAFSMFPTANVADAIGKPCPATLDPAIRPGFKGGKLVGSALTVHEAPDCNLMSHAAIDLMKPGDVLVVDVGAYTGTAVGGFLMVRKMMSKKAAGVLVDGAWRDNEEVTESGFPVFARAWTPGGPHKDLPGSINIPVTIGGVVIHSGDIIVGDDDGVVVVPRISAANVLEKAKDIADREEKKKADTGKAEVEKPSPYATPERLRKLGVVLR